ncbi:NlpC/P60 family protein [Robertmurraya sp. DFI.2.37]|uniref:coiled-coil domain-containing protein n=1 Tax=Robertmurraya sp. DFI.2.37 TaxID=3031819 RepID=UPI0023DBB4C3|nr:C40 family peptidase [Robertmurraya sp. DFI.2.37]MDF1510080.1 NlpC/P60 family protein [Robertmurraya sp. DFI.2.37]
MMKKKLVALNTTIILGVGSLVTIPSVSADYSSQIQQVEQKIDETENKIAALEKKIQKMNEAIEDNNKLIATTEKEIAVTQEEIKKLKEEIAVLNDTIEKRTEVLAKRAQSFQESGGKVGYIEVLLGSENFSDFIDRVFAVTQIANADSDLIKQHELDKAAVEEKQAEVDQKLAELTDKKEELEGMKAQMLEQKKENDQLKNSLEEAQKGNLAKLDELEEKARQEEEARRQAQLEAERALRAQAQTSNSNSSASNSSSGGSKVAYTPPANDGSLNTILQAGYKYIGNSVYVFGGGRTAYDVANGRFDCSGFVSWAFRQAGISIGSSTSTLRNQGTKVSYSEARPGDLVFFDTYKKDGHVGIYLGGGKFIGSQSSTGVAIANMNSGYYKNTFKGHVRRVANF